MSEGEPKKSYDSVPEGKRLELHVSNLPAEIKKIDNLPVKIASKEKAPVEEFADFLTNDEQQRFEGKDREEIIRHIFINAVGEKATATISPEMWARISRRDQKAQAVWTVIHKMKTRGMGSVIDGDEKLSERAGHIFNKAERSGEKSGNVPEGLPSTEEAEEASQEKTIMRRIAKRGLGIAEGAMWAAGSPVQAAQHLATKFQLFLHGGMSEKWNDKFRDLSPEEQRKYKKRAAWRANLGALALGGLYLASRGHALNFIGDAFDHHHGSGSGATPEVPSHDQGHDHNTPAPEQHFDPNHPDTNPADFHYDPNLDPARDGAKHHNDWGTALHASPDDGDKPAGYADFFDTRLHHSPEELSATLTEFGLNDKNNVTGLANQMVADPALAAQKYDQLMNYIHDNVKSVSIVTDGRDYGSYYAVANPDGTVTLSYDQFVESSSNLQIHGPTGNDFMAFTMKDGSVHYGHIDCGMQWSHFINTPAPHHASPTPAPHYVPSQPHYTPPPTHNVPPSSPPPVTPPPETPPPPVTPPPETPPPPPPPPLEGKGVEAGPAAVHPLPVDLPEAAPAHVDTGGFSDPVPAPTTTTIGGSHAPLHTSGPVEGPHTTVQHGSKPAKP